MTNKTWDKVSKENKKFFWQQVLENDYEVALAIEANDVPTLKQVSVFHYGKKETESIRTDLIGLAVEELK